VRLGCRWFAANALVEGDRVDLGTLRPGAEANVALPVVAPDRPGRWRLAVSVIQDGIAWFDDLDPAYGAVVEVEVDHVEGRSHRP
jgi:hypothetical protein